MSNIQTMVDNYSDISTSIAKYSTETPPSFIAISGGEVVNLSVYFSNSDDSYSVAFNNTPDHIRFYLEKYVLITESISLHNKTQSNKIDTFSNTFAMLSAFRNYTTFSLNSSLGSDPREQVRNIRNNDSNSNNDQGGEPSLSSM